MKKRLPLLGVLLAVPLLLAGIRLGSTSSQMFSWENLCDGGNGQNVTEGTYALSVTDTKVYICVGDAGCASGGWPASAGLVMSIDFSQTTPVSCRSGDLTGDIALLRTP